MQLKILFKLDEPLELPLSYNHIIQSALLNLGKNDESEYARELHSNKENDHTYRLFCFGQLMGKHEVLNGKIKFDESIKLEVRSISSSWILEINKRVTKNGMLLGDRAIWPEWTELLDRNILSNYLTVRMLSPITVHTTDIETNRTNYYSPDEEEFSSLINTNFQNKWKSAYGEMPTEGICIEKVRVSPRDKVVTKYKGYFYITAWGGEYVLHGTPEALEFLYNTGIGAKNSQGFGMMEII